MRSRWPLRSLAKCAKFLSGGTPNKARSEFWEGDIPWVSSGEMREERIHDTPLHISREGADDGSRLVPENTVLAVVRGMSLAKEFRVAITKREVAFNQDLKALSCEPDVVPVFLFYALLARRGHIRDLATEASHGTKKLETDVLSVFEIPIPKTIDEQSHVVEVLSTYDDLIENNRRRMALLEEAARQLYREWFVRLRFPGHEHVRIRNGVPEGWAKKALGDLAHITMGQSPESQHYNEDGEGLPFHQGVTDFGERFVTHRIYSTALNRVAEAGDILCSVRAPVGRLNVTLDKIVIGRGLSALRSRAGHQSLLLQQLRAHFFKEDLIGGGAIFASVTKKEFSAQELLDPPERLKRAFEEVTILCDEQLRVLHQQNQQLRAARDLLLPRLMSGEMLA